jgi:hypothetical protein
MIPTSLVWVSSGIQSTERRAAPAHVLVVGKVAGSQRILEDDALSCAENVLENGRWQIIDADTALRRSTITRSLLLLASASIR